MLNEDASKACHELVRYSCRRNCSSRCKCKQCHFECTELCKCVGQCSDVMNRDNKFISFRFLFLQFINITALDAWTEYPSLKIAEETKFPRTSTFCVLQRIKLYIYTKFHADITALGPGAKYPYLRVALRGTFDLGWYPTVFSISNCPSLPIFILVSLFAAISLENPFLGPGT